MEVYTRISIGDTLDRISILLIKSYKLKDPMQIGNVVRELTELLNGLNQTGGQEDDQDNIDRALRDLIKVNDDLWNLEEEIRKATKANDKSLVFHLVQSIHQLNSERAEIKRWISSETGSYFREIKDYATSSNNEP